MIIKGGWSDNDTIDELVEFLQENRFALDKGKCFYVLDEELFAHSFEVMSGETPNPLLDSLKESDCNFMAKHGVLIEYATKESIAKQKRFLELCTTSLKRLLNKKEKDDMVEFLTEKWYKHRKDNFSENEQDANDPHFEIVNSVREVDSNGEACYCFCKCGGTIVVM